MSIQLCNFLASFFACCKPQMQNNESLPIQKSRESREKTSRTASGALSRESSTYRSKGSSLSYKTDRDSMSSTVDASSSSVLIGDGMSSSEDTSTCVTVLKDNEDPPGGAPPRSCVLRATPPRQTRSEASAGLVADSSVSFGGYTVSVVVRRDRPGPSSRASSSPYVARNGSNRLRGAASSDAVVDDSRASSKDVSSSAITIRDSAISTSGDLSQQSHIVSHASQASSLPIPVASHPKPISQAKSKSHGRSIYRYIPEELMHLEQRTPPPILTMLRKGEFNH